MVDSGWNWGMRKMVLWIAAAFAAYFVKGLCGFANTLVFTSILGFGTANVDISPVDLLMGCPSNLLMTWRYRAHIDRRIVLPLSALVLLGSIPGAAILRVVDVRRIWYNVRHEDINPRNVGAGRGRVLRCGTV